MNWYKQSIRIREFSIQKALDILGLQPGAGESEIKSARNRLAKKYHTDKGSGSHEKMAEVNVAFEFLRSHDFNTSVGRSYAPRPERERRRPNEDEEEWLRRDHKTPPWETDFRSSYFNVGTDFRNLNFCKKSIWEESLKNGPVDRYTLWSFDGYFRGVFTVFTNEATLGYAGRAMYEWSAKGANSYNIVAVFAQRTNERILKLVNKLGIELNPPWKEYAHDSFNNNPGNDKDFVRDLRKEFLPYYQ